MRFAQDNPDPPAPPLPEPPKTVCCWDPTPSVHEGVVYCECCETEWVPATHLAWARELYVESAGTKEPRSAAGERFDRAILAHAEKTYIALPNIDADGVPDEDAPVDP